MIYNRIFKLQTERFFLTGSIVDCKHEPTEEVQLSGSSATAIDKDGADVSTSVLDSSTLAVINHPNRPTDGTNAALTIRVRAGSAAKSPYKIILTMATTLGNVFQVQQDLQIQS